MDAELRDALSRSFGPEAVRTKKGQGGRAMDYVSHGMVTKRLNDVAPDWTAEMIERWITETNGTLHCLGGIMRMTIGGVTREEAGGPTRLTTLADDLKNTYSDCLKRCAMRFGVALDMWESADENDEDAQGQQQQQPPARQSRTSPHSSPSPQPAPQPPVAAGTLYSKEEFDGVIDKAWEMAEDGKHLGDIRDYLNKSRHGMSREQRNEAMAALNGIEEKYPPLAAVK